jgi:hypothetical protein
MSDTPSVIAVLAAALTAAQDRHGTDAVDPRVLQRAVAAHGAMGLPKLDDSEPDRGAVPVRKAATTTNRSPALARLSHATAYRD